MLADRGGQAAAVDGMVVRDDDARRHGDMEAVAGRFAEAEGYTKTLTGAVLRDPDLLPVVNFTISPQRIT